MKAILVAAAVAVGLFVTGALAQHEGHQAAPAADKGDTAKMGGMMAAHDETGKLVDELVKNFEAIQAEQAPAALQEKLAEHSKLLHELQTKIHDQAKMMEMMHQMMGGAMMQGKMADHK